ncbi:hypothetical protein V2J09_004799 [Rumex salicifolius]
MAAEFSNQQNPTKTPHKPIENKDHPTWFSPENGVYNSKFSPIQLPTDPNLDVVSFIFSHKHSGNSALVDSSSGSFISYAELFPLVKSMAFGLHQLGVSKGDVVLILLPNSIFYPVIVLGAIYLGAIAAPVNPLSSFFEAKKQTLECHAKWAFTTSVHLDQMEGLGVKAIEVPEDVGPTSQTTKFSTFHSLISSDCKNLQEFRDPISQDDTAAIMCSSGTTGSSKCVVISHRNLISMVELFVRFEASQYKDQFSWRNVYLAVVPMFHIYGLALYVMGLFSLGTCVVVMKRFNIDDVVKAINEYGVTHFPVVPPLLRALTVKANHEKCDDLKSLKQVSCGAAATSRMLIDDFVSTFPHVDFVQGYGLTESTAVGTRGFNTETVHNYTSAGLLAPSTQAKVVDCITGSCVPPGKPGELWLRGPGIMKGYLNNKEATESAIEEDGWLHTGDLVYFDHDGYLYILDRIKDMIKYNGFQIAPADLEAILITHPKILDAGVTGVVDEQRGEVPVAFVVRKPESELSSNEVMKFVEMQVAPYKKVRKVVFVASIPKSPAGKILRRHLRSTLLSKKRKEFR